MSPENNRHETSLRDLVLVAVRSGAAIAGATAAAFGERELALAIAVAIAVGDVIVVFRRKRTG